MRGVGSGGGGGAGAFFYVLGAVRSWSTAENSSRQQARACCAVLCCAVETVLPSVVLLYCAVLTGTVGLFLGVETPVTTPTGITFSMLSFFFGFSLTSLSQLQIPALKFELGTWKPS